MVGILKPLIFGGFEAQKAPNLIGLMLYTLNKIFVCYPFYQIDGFILIYEVLHEIYEVLHEIYEVLHEIYEVLHEIYEVLH
ncbi:hypothetical protein, partial [Moorena sp. SIO4G3]|uniref:hypothetical protein n=1 Tax=Moorena sp. SIO4G3 TaxID=2607821 RepID=UPI0025E0DD1E